MAMQRDTSIYASMYADGASYEDSYSKDPSLAKFLKTLPVGLKPQSTVLDLGCGTGKPVASVLSSLGHKVTGLEISEDLVALCQKQVPDASFEVGDMLTYSPKHKYDCVLTILSLFLFDRVEIERLATKWATWVTPGGLIGVGSQLAEHVAKTYPKTTNIDPNGQTTPPGELALDADGRCARNIDWWFMNAPERLTLFTRQGWHDMLHEKGFDVLWDNAELFTPLEGSGCLPAMHYFLIARRREVSSL